MRRLIWLTGWMSLAAVAQSVIDPNTGEVVRDAAASKARVASFAEEVSSGKMAEEGQGHIGHALAYYSNVIRDFDSIRKPVAQALFQYAGLMIGSNTPRVGVDAFRRILREFADFEELANASRARLRDPGAADGPGAVSGEGGAGGVGGDASINAFYQRYGHGPEATLPPELAKRYGIGFGGGGSGGGRGGGGMAAGAGDASESVSAPSAGSGSAKPQVDDIGRTRNPAAVMMEEMATSMRAELIQLATQLRKVQREQRVAEIDDLDQLPLNLIEDATMSRILADLQKAREEVVTNAPLLDKSQRDRLVKARQEVGTVYLKESYRPRLAKTADFLREEIDRLRAEIERSEMEAKELRSAEKSR